MLMKAGSGIYHEEGIREDDETVEMLQIFIRPEADGLEPKIQFHKPDETYSLNTWRLLAGYEHSLSCRMMDDIRPTLSVSDT